MHKIFSLDGQLFALLGKAADLILLNLLWILCCIPIVTIGASTTALNSVTLKMSRNEESYIAKSFFCVLKENLRQASIVWFFILLAGGFLSCDLFLTRQFPSTLQNIPQAVVGAASILFILMLNYLFPLLAQFQNSIKNTCLNALLMSLVHFPYTILLSTVTFIPVILMYYYPVVFVYGIFVYLFIGGALTAYINAFFLKRIFKKYMPEAAPVME